MNYEFSLNKRAALSLIAGWIVIALLLFASGWIVGSQFSANGSTSTESAVAENDKTDLPTEPVLNDEAPDQKSGPPKSVKPTTTEPDEAAAQTPEKTAAAVQFPAPQSSEAALAEERADDTDDAAPDAASIENEVEYVTVQVGVFLDENEASRLLKQIERKGYAPTFFSGRDAEARQWYAVRIGAYSDRQQAANAAANFARQEKMKAVVRPLGSL